jgi:hypothetical protein
MLTSLSTGKHPTFPTCESGVAKLMSAGHVKDWGDTRRTCYLVGYSKTPLGYRVYIPELKTEIISVHCIFEEVIPERDEE